MCRFYHNLSVNLEHIWLKITDFIYFVPDKDVVKQSYSNVDFPAITVSISQLGLWLTSPLL